MSKSLGNGIDPLDVIDKYGADALRLTLITEMPLEMICVTQKNVLLQAVTLQIKIWNASRFIMMNLEQADFSDVTLEDLLADKWILSKKLNTLPKMLQTIWINSNLVLQFRN